MPDKTKENLPSVKEIREWLWLDENGGSYGLLVNKGSGIWKMVWCPGQKSACTINGTLAAIKRIAKGLMKDLIKNPEYGNYGYAEDCGC